MNDITFDEYKSWVEKYIKNNDIREINFQNEVVKRLINNICPDLDVVYSDKKGPDSTIHNYFQYCGTYSDDNLKKKAVTPDLVIAKNWNWRNTTNKVDYRAVVEVKSPFLDQRIYNKEYKDYEVRLKDELKRHLSAEKNNNVILTDALKWEFYIKNDKVNEITPIRTFRLYDLSNNGRVWGWKKDKQDLLEKNAFKDISIKHLDFTKQVKEFNELKKYLIKFLNKEDKNSNLSN